MRPATRRPINWSKLTRNVVSYTGALLLAVWVLGPIYWIVLSSFSAKAEIVATPPHWIPQAPTLDNYKPLFANLFTGRPPGSQADMILPALWNSLVIGLIVAAINVTLGSLAAYAFARLRFTGRRTLLLGILASQMVPAFALIIPFYVVFSRIGLTNTRLGVVVAHLSFTLPFTVWILRSYIQSISVELEWAARVDGCSRTQVLLRVVFPLAVPGLITAGLFAFMGSWNEFLFALVITSLPKAMPIQPAISSMYNVRQQTFGVMAAAAVLAAFPTIILTLIFQRYLVQGLLSGAVKG
jgi:multiple sugar transport system permease protein